MYMRKEIQYLSKDLSKKYYRFQLFQMFLLITDIARAWLSRNNDSRTVANCLRKTMSETGNFLSDEYYFHATDGESTHCSRY